VRALNQFGAVGRQSKGLPVIQLQRPGKKLFLEEKFSPANLVPIDALDPLVYFWPQILRQLPPSRRSSWDLPVDRQGVPGQGEPKYAPCSQPTLAQSMWTPSRGAPMLRQSVQNLALIIRRPLTGILVPDEAILYEARRIIQVLLPEVPVRARLYVFRPRRLCPLKDLLQRRDASGRHVQRQ